MVCDRERAPGLSQAAQGGKQRWWAPAHPLLASHDAGKRRLSRAVCARRGGFFASPGGLRPLRRYLGSRTPGRRIHMLDSWIRSGAAFGVGRSPVLAAASGHHHTSTVSIRTTCAFLPHNTAAALPWPAVVHIAPCPWRLFVPSRRTTEEIAQRCPPLPASTYFDAQTQTQTQTQHHAPAHTAPKFQRA